LVDELIVVYIVLIKNAIAILLEFAIKEKYGKNKQ